MNLIVQTVISLFVKNNIKSLYLILKFFFLNNYIILRTIIIIIFKSICFVIWILIENQNSTLQLEKKKLK